MKRRLPWVRATDLGDPVVPEEERMQIVSFWKFVGVSQEISWGFVTFLKKFSKRFLPSSWPNTTMCSSEGISSLMHFNLSWTCLEQNATLGVESDAEWSISSEDYLPMIVQC